MSDPMHDEDAMAVDSDDESMDDGATNNIGSSQPGTVPSPSGG
eukprot:CAMPEP_0183308634 /NCGR_PEP_ID=MMETSP0160_2-20130417/22373_1 /TAXON_ID=2839 ORGANISM="Odontella Sinensis, Strain Grunow 1884" /NCGR_SAMPLE_ID=MMETSP0160_2 /ASSEMBLY_ACC=CAM_ASM_000250 /LENGTH=42 /DNA_ID= /DNA_START= /DNA_END= /DNA_ORIENTATION=